MILGPPALAPMASETGHPFHAGGEPPEAQVTSIRERLPVVAAPEASVLGDRELFGRLATAAMLEETGRLCAAWEPDLILREPCEYASAVVAARTGIPVGQVAISLAEAEAGAIATAAPALEEHRPGLPDALRGWPYLTRFPVSLDPSPFADTRRYRDAGGAPAGTGPGELTDWWDGAGSPLVYVTFGTVLGSMSAAAQVFATALTAVAELDARVLVTVGTRFDLAGLPAVAGHVHVERWVDQDRVLPHADVVLCHGGSGTTLGALAAGVPMVIVPSFADQFENGRRISAAGAGVVVTTDGAPDHGTRRPITPADAPRVAAALDEVLSDSSYRDAAVRISRQLAAAPDVDEILTRLLTAPRTGA